MTGIRVATSDDQGYRATNRHACQGHLVKIERIEKSLNRGNKEVGVIAGRRDIRIAVARIVERVHGK